MLDGPDNKVTPRLYNLSRPSPCKTRFVRFGSAKRVNGVSKQMEGDQKSILDNIKNGQPDRGNFPATASARWSSDRLVAAAVGPDGHDVVHDLRGQAGEFREEYRGEARAVGALIAGKAAVRRD